MVTDYIKCPYLYAQNSLSSKNHIIKISDMHVALKKHLVEIASYEMKNQVKLTAVEYRTKFTNKYYRKASHLFSSDSIIKELNLLFDVFANNVFVGYNVPVEVPIAGTSAEYRDFADFVLMDEDKNITVVQLDEILDIKDYTSRVENWVHYTIIYSYLASKFNGNISVNIIDPNTLTRLGISFPPERFDADYEQINSMLLPIANKVLYKNLFMCENCDKHEDCEKWKK